MEVLVYYITLLKQLLITLLLHRCDRCDNYETINKAAFSAHQDQCLASGEAGESAEGIEGTENDGDGEEGHSGIRSHRKMFECDVCNMKFSNGANMRRHKVGLKERKRNNYITHLGNPYRIFYIVHFLFSR